MKQILALNPSTYQRHLIHGENRTWAETNCYSDVIIELVHGLGHEPIAGLPFTLAADFEGDQWTFFKFPISDLYDLYGMEIQELNPWRSLVHHVEEQVAQGRPVLVELDSFFLPDTVGTAYKIAHVKSTVAVNLIDIQAKRMGYFHNQSYHVLQGQDFDDIFQVNGLVHERMLPPYIEFVRLHPRKFSQSELTGASITLLKKHLARAPTKNPFPMFKARFEKDMEWLAQENIELFHAYSFATLRQYGACYELSETYLRWLANHGQTGLDRSIEAFQQITQSTKSFQFQLARAMARKKPLDMSPLDAMAAQWDAGISELRGIYG